MSGRAAEDLKVVIFDCASCPSPCHIVVECHDPRDIANPNVCPWSSISEKVQWKRREI